MINKKFFAKKKEFLTIEEIISLTDTSLEKGKEQYLKQKIYEVAILNEANAEEISFLHSSSYVKYLTSSKAGFCFIEKKYLDKKPPSMTGLIAEDPYFAYSKLINALYQEKKSYQKKSCHNVKIGKNVTIMTGAYIGENVTIGDNCVIDVNSYIGDNVTIGSNVIIHPLVNISFATIGDNSIIYSGVKIGQDGFGYVHNKGKNYKILQLGIVEIGEDVEIGVNSCVDRGAIGNTVISNNVKIDNLVQIAHNVFIDQGTVIAATTGIAGSSKIGKFVQIGGNASISGHLTIGDGAKIAGMSGVMKNIESMAIIGGIPAIPIKDWHRSHLKMMQLIKKKIF